MFDDYAYYSKKEIVSDVEQPVYGTNDRGKEEKQYAMGVLSLKSDQNNDSSGTGSGGTDTNPGTGTGGNTSSGSSGSSTLGLDVKHEDIFNAASARKADMLKAIGEFYDGPWYDNEDGKHLYNSYGFTPLMMATQAQCYDSIDYILGKIDNNNHEDQENIKRLYDAVYQKHEKITDDDSSRRSAVKIAQDNKDTEAENKLKKWLTAYVHEIKYTNSKHTDLKIQVPASETAFKGDSILLPSITGKYISTNEDEPIRWEPKRWRISKSDESIESGKDYSFNTKYTLDYNVVAALICVKSHVTLTYSFGDVQTDIELPNSVTIQSGSKITLGGATGEYKDKDNIRWEATGWTIDESGKSHEFNTEYTIYDDTVAVLNLEKVPVTLTYLDGNNLGIDIDPKSSTVPCGDPIKLHTFDFDENRYTDENHIVWDLLGWTIGETVYNFGDTYNIYENTDAYLKCEKAKVKLTYKSEYPIDIPVPTEETYTSGDTAKLKSVTGEYKDTSEYKKYTPTEWVIDGSSYDFDEDYKIYDNTEAKLKCEVSDIPVGIVIEPTSLTFDEGASKLVTFKLKSEPNEEVVLKLSNRFDGLGIEKSELKFDSSNWTGQSVEFFALDDDIDNTNKHGTVTVSVTSKDTYYDSVPDETLSVTIVNNDTAGIEHRLNSTTITEGNTTMCFFKLKSKPTSPVKLNIAITSGSDRLSISDSSLTFTESNWKDEQSIELKATNNTTADGDTTATIKVTVDPSSLDSKYSALGPISFNITIKDNDIAGVNYDTSTLTVTEGASLPRGFSLKSKPTGDVTLNFTSTYGRITAPSLTFTSSDWNAIKYPKFTAGNVVGTDIVTISASSTDSNYNRTMGSFNVNITAAPDIDYSDLPMDLTEGSYVRRQFKLTAQPKDSVKLTISSNITSRLYIGTSSTSTTASTTLTFTTSNYGTAQYVYFRAKDDEIVNGDISGTIQIVATSSDDQYKNLSKTFNVTVKDNDSASIGTPAFESGYFTVDIDPGTLAYTTEDDDDVVTYHSYDVKEQWGSVYSEGYTVEQVPKSPYYTENNKVFTYDFLYPETLDD